MAIGTEPVVVNSRLVTKSAVLRPREPSHCDIVDGGLHGISPAPRPTGFEVHLHVEEKHYCIQKSPPRLRQLSNIVYISSSTRAQAK